VSELDQLMRVMEVSFDPHYREAWTRRQVEDSLLVPSTFAMLCNEAADATAQGEKAAGFVLARQAADEIELLLIAVNPEHRKKGVGSRLLERFLEVAAQRKASKVFLEMRANNPAVSVYRAAGFEQIGQRANYYRTITGETIDALTFGRKV
tara:strand:- start:540 stop:992 length:453 start_codon:yes stop_codon:yes gene_type:complete